ncbi:response regulator [Brevibacillus massiliensis]|uniref:response regulator n=1 Tax=Brevibacillus massiliensis TaxID=1118054 RepID=UPI0003128A8C|nr:response regulator [Brevibacillus massiliensis]
MTSFFLIDDDVAARRMLATIIEDSDLGRVVSEAEDGYEIEQTVMRYAPDVLIIDYLMPKQDGIETIRRLSGLGFAGKIVMLSQVEHKEMVSEAYQQGIEYYIHKPINRMEVVAVLRKVMERIHLEESIRQIRRSLAWMDPGSAPEDRGRHEQTVSSIARSILTELGVVGEAGCRDVTQIIQTLIDSGFLYDERNFPALKDLYASILPDAPSSTLVEKEVKAIEQRVRRTVAQALLNVASLGLTDYGNPTFEGYATRYFDFADVRQKMREIEEEEPYSRVRLNLKKFLYALYLDVTAKAKS